MMKLVVLSCLLAAASAGLIAPIVPIAYTTPLLTPYNYRGPLSLAPGQPASILGSDGRPLDTLEVNLDRSAHLTAKTLGLHLLKKRSAPLFAAYSNVAVAHSPLITPAATLAYATPLLAPNNYRGPLSLAPGQPANILGLDGRPLDTLEVNLDRSAHLTAKTLGLHLLKKRSAPLFAPYSNIAVAHSSLIAPAATLAYATPLLASNNYRGPLSLAPGQPASILGSDGRPLDTLEVNLDRSAHLTAKTLGLHLLKKRSAPLIAPYSNIAVAHSSLITPAASLAYTAPYGAHLAPISYATTPLIHW